MLKGIDPLLTADLIWLLASMGHGECKPATTAPTAASC
jgi:L-fucose mutarotase/ribose pyranase (RbsD/FucU family)